MKNKSTQTVSFPILADFEDHAIPLENVPALPNGQEGPVVARYNWRRMNHLQVGRFAEYFVKMEFSLYGFEVYSAEVDDRGIDFVVRYECGPFYEIQVKSIRGLNYVFMQQDKFPLRPDRIAAVVVLLEDKPPELYLIPAPSWESPNDLLVRRDYGQGKKSKPEWGLNLSTKNLPLLDKFRFDAVVASLMKLTFTGPSC
jgi:hypothetical protein